MGHHRVAQRVLELAVQAVHVEAGERDQEAEDRREQQREDGPQMGLFDATAETEIDFEDAEEPDALRERLEEIDPDALSPREALALLYELKDL